MDTLQKMQLANMISMRWQKIFALVCSFSLFALAVDTGSSSASKLTSLPFVLLGLAVPIAASSVVGLTAHWWNADTNSARVDPTMEACRLWCVLLAAFLTIRHVEELAFIENWFFSLKLPSLLTALIFTIALSVFVGALLTFFRLTINDRPLVLAREVLLLLIFGGALGLTLY